MQIFGAIIYVFIWKKEYLLILSCIQTAHFPLTFSVANFTYFQCPNGFEIVVKLATLLSFELFTYGTETWVIWKSPIWVLGIWKRWWKDHFVRWWYKQWISLADCNGICWWRCPWLFILRGILKFIFSLEMLNTQFQSQLTSEYCEDTDWSWQSCFLQIVW